VIRFEQEMSGVKIVKVGAPPPAPETKKKSAATSRKSSMKTFPKGILKRGSTARAKVKPVKDPAKAPPKQGRTLRILTDKGAENRRARIRKTVRAMPDQKVRQALRKHGIKVSDKAPKQLVEEIAVSAQQAGMVSLG
jgi:hypothetical protein